MNTYHLHSIVVDSGFAYATNSRIDTGTVPACDCKSGYKYVCEEFGPTNPGDFCQNGIKYYKSCKTCGDYGYLTSCPVGIECSFEQCSGKYFPTGKCASGYTDISDASCSWYKYWIPCSVAPERPSGT